MYRPSGLIKLITEHMTNTTFGNKLTVLYHLNSVVAPIKALPVPQKKIANTTKKKHTV